MRRYEDTRIADEYKQRIADIVEGRRELRGGTYERDMSFFHLSEGIGLCLNSTYLARTIEIPPPLPYRTALKFFMGRAFEKGITHSCRIFKDGIGGEIDDYSVDNYIRELKATHETIINFTPHEHWVEQLMGYCYMTEETRGDIVVLFWAGNLMSYTSWGIKDIEEYKGNPRKWSGSTYFSELKYNPIDIRAWNYEFTTGEIENNWQSIQERIGQLKNHLKLKTQPEGEIISRRLPEWLCKICKWQPDHCKHWQKYIGTEGK